ncbi:PREDICTED: E3 ubiquitin-protein ligase HECTD3-like, partial [Eurypyga helias]
WEQAVDLSYSMRTGGKPRLIEEDEAAVQKFRSVPPGWSYDHDMELARFLYDYSMKDRGNCTKDYIRGVEVSSEMDDCSAAHLTDNQTTTWESNGPQGQHWVRLNMKKGTIVKKLWLVLDGQSHSYIPRRVAVYGGELDRLYHLRTVLISENSYREVCILRDMKTHLPVLEIRILECREHGQNVRLQGIKIKSSWEWDLILNADIFQPSRLVRYPLLEGVDNDVLYRRAVLIQRFVQLMDSVLHYLISPCEYSSGSFNALRSMKQFLLLSKQSTALIAHCLQSSETPHPYDLPKLHINRHLAREHRANPALDPSCKNTVFSQLYENLKPPKNNQPLDYRWPANSSQWWQCEFISEGIIDQGGGFRDSLSDVSEELCPSSSNVPMPLPFFVRTSNQGNSSSDTRDMYVPNPSCKEFPKYQWIGQLMGGALRGKEFLTLALPALVWKQLAGEEVSWRKDFATVDLELVKLLEVLDGVDRETFEFMFGRELTYIAAMRAGLLRVVPQPVLDLLTWQQLEKKVCGDPEITVAKLRNFIKFEGFSSNDTRVQMFLEALNNFTSEDLSHFLKFVTGRSRLPVQISIYPERAELNAMDLLPQASTCSCTFFLPNYSSAKACEELLRYAVYNCVSIDTDRNAWDE